MKVAITAILLTMLFVIPAVSQVDIDDYKDTKGEIVFVTGTIDGSLSQYIPTVKIEGVGPIFNDQGVYSRIVSDECDQKSEYVPGSDIFTRSPRNMFTTEGQYIVWESAYDGDDYYVSASGKCAGLLGWGEYAFTITINQTSKTIYVSTLDGEWMDLTPDEENKIIFHVDFESGPQIDVNVYNWDDASWETVDDEEWVTLWELRGESRDRAYISVLSDTPFTIDADEGSSDIPFDGLNEVHFDIDVRVEGIVSVPATKSLLITDDYDEIADTWFRSHWYFDATGRIINSGTLDVHSDNDEVATSPFFDWGVVFQPNSTAQIQRESWYGIRNYSGGELDIRNARIVKAHQGIKGANGPFTVRNSVADSCKIGIHACNAQALIIRDSIVQCRFGILMTPLWGDRKYHKSLVDTCTILSSIVHGIHLGGMFESFITGEAGILQPEDNVLIRESTIRFNGGNGVYAAYSDAAFLANDISKNGWRWGRYPTSSEDSTGDGVNLRGGICHFNSNNIFENTGHGIRSRIGVIRAEIKPGYWIAQGDPHGRNCFYYNFAQVYVKGDGATAEFGVPGNSAFKNDFNSFDYPRMITDQMKPVNFYAENALRVEGDHNYWNTFNSQELRGAFYASFTQPITDPDSVRCSLGTDGSTSVDTSGALSESSRNILQLIRVDSLKEAYDSCRVYMSDALNETDAGVVAWALKMIRIQTTIDSARILLANEVFDETRTECPSHLDAHALIALQELYIRSGDSTNAWRLYDTLYAWEGCETFAFDTASAELYRYDIELYVERDSTTALSLITDLYTDYPADASIRNEYLTLSGDTMALYGVVPTGKRSRSEDVINPSDLRILTCAPNPFNPSTTVRFQVYEKMALHLLVYAMDGKLVDRIRIGEKAPGIHHYEYYADHLPSGAYVLRLTNGRSVATYKVVLQK